MPAVDANWWALLVTVVITMFVGAIWYDSRLFGKPWSKLTGKKMADGRVGLAYGLTAFGALLQSWILLHFVRYAGALDLWRGAQVGFWLWLGFVAVVMMTNFLFEGRPHKLLQINAGYFLVVLVINAAILAAWR